MKNYWKENYLNLMQSIEEEKNMTIRNINIDYSQDHLTTKEHEKLVKRAEEKAEMELAELKKLAQK